MAIDPVTAKLLAQTAIRATDKESRERTLTIIIVLIVIFIVLFMLPFYILSTPLELLGIFEGDTDYEIIKEFQENTLWYVADEDIDMSDWKVGYVIDSSINISGDMVDSGIPLFLQGDRRWGFYPYGGGTISSSGCGPTSLAMIAVGLTHNENINPKVVADYSASKGWKSSSGTAWNLFTVGAENYGLKGVQVSYSANSITENLRAGKPMICSMKPGHFTKGGHFIVLRGITADGKILVNDPASKNRSNQEWNVSIIANEAKGAWAYTARE